MIKMTESKKVKAFKELHSLILFYAENRDMPVDPNFDFFGDIKFYCDQLDLDFDEFTKTFGLKQLF